MQRQSQNAGILAALKEGAKITPMGALRREDCEFITKLNEKRIFGGAFLMADRAAADRAAADRAAARRTFVQELDENAKAILKRLNKNS